MAYGTVAERSVGYGNSGSWRANSPNRTFSPMVRDGPVVQSAAPGPEAHQSQASRPLSRTVSRLMVQGMETTLASSAEAGSATIPLLEGPSGETVPGVFLNRARVLGARDAGVRARDVAESARSQAHQRLLEGDALCLRVKSSNSSSRDMGGFRRRTLPT